MMITTREAINYQFSLIFGYSSSKDDNMVVGDVIGPGTLMKEKVEDLSCDVIKFLRMYNAILRDYTGSELYAIEFSLFNKDELQKEGSSSIKIYPKSMILLPGKYKDCECSLLALKPEPDVLNPHKSRDIMNHICELFNEIEEFSERPQIDNNSRGLLLQKFSSRFSQKLYGELLENKWNKKLVGLNVTLPTGKDMIDNYAKVKSDLHISWYKIPHVISFINPYHELYKSLYRGKNAIEHLKYAITEPSSDFIVGHTIRLGVDLFDLCNTGTIDEMQDKFISFLIKTFNDDLKQNNRKHNINQLMIEFKELIIKTNHLTNKFLEHSNTFVISGKKGNIDELLEQFNDHIVQKGKYENENYEILLELTTLFIKQSVFNKKNLRASELNSIFNNLKELFSNSYDIIKTSLPKYLISRCLKNTTKNLVSFVKEDLNNEKEHIKILGGLFIEKMNEFILNQIEIYPIAPQIDLEKNEVNIIKNFNLYLARNLESFFKTITIKITDIILLLENNPHFDLKLIEKNIEFLKKYPGELNYFVNYIMKYSTINRFLKDNPEDEISDPVTFSNKFHRFVEKRFGGITLVWKPYLLSWFNDYAKQYFKELDKKPMTLDDIYHDFLEFFMDREIEEQKPENFFSFLEEYSKKLTSEQEKSEINKFLLQFKHYLELSVEFPKNLKQLIEARIQSYDIKQEESLLMEFLHIDEGLSFYQFVKEKELKYFSNLIPRPSSLILKHQVSDEERSLFHKPLYHVINFKYWHGHSSYSIADNFKNTFREWEKQV